MSDTVIRVENLGKKYIIGHQRQQRYTALRDVITDSAKYWGRRVLHSFRSPNGAGHPTREEFWALKDVSFEVKRGEVIGIIGRNGAGKSTLLKVLSRITEPSEGRVRIKGRVASLLEVGTGFHPELTGRENIYLNGAILGMSRVEIKRKFDEIVAFAEVEKFLDTPVKRYSSGMYVRLAFAVAAHLEPEILLVDEVLAVGDAAFQKKCLDKMKDVEKSGQTIIFVSHNMETIQSLCKRSVVLDKGKIIADEPSLEAIKIYLQKSAGSESFSRSKQKNGRPTLVSGMLLPMNQGNVSMVQVVLQVYTDEPHHAALDIRLKDSIGTPVAFGSFGAMRPSDMINLEPPLSEVRFDFLTNRLANGSYLISLDLTIPGIEYYDRAENCLSFDLRRQPEAGAIYVLPQDWRYGCMELTLENIQVLTHYKEYEDE